MKVLHTFSTKKTFPGGSFSSLESHYLVTREYQILLRENLTFLIFRPVIPANPSLLLSPFFDTLSHRI